MSQRSGDPDSTCGSASRFYRGPDSIGIGAFFLMSKRSGDPDSIGAFFSPSMPRCLDALVPSSWTRAPTSQQREQIRHANKCVVIEVPRAGSRGGRAEVQVVVDRRFTRRIDEQRSVKGLV